MTDFQQILYIVEEGDLKTTYLRALKNSDLFTCIMQSESQQLFLLKDESRRIDLMVRMVQTHSDLFLKNLVL